VDVDVDPCAAQDETHSCGTLAPAPTAVKSDDVAAMPLVDDPSSNVRSLVAGAQEQQQLGAEAILAPDVRESVDEAGSGLCTTTNMCSPALSCSKVVVNDLLQGSGLSVASSSCPSASSSSLSTRETAMLLELLTTLNAEISGMNERFRVTRPDIAP